MTENGSSRLKNSANTIHLLCWYDSDDGVRWLLCIGEAQLTGSSSLKDPTRK